MRLAALGACLGILGCSPPTELVVVVDSNLTVPDEIDAVEVEVEAPDGTSRAATQSLVEADGPTFPLTLGVAPEGESLGPIVVRAIGRRGGAEEIRVEAEVTLVAGTTRVLELFLLRSCVGRSCAEGSICGVTGCELRARADLEVWEGTAPGIPDDPCLARQWDVDGDGEGDVLCGGQDCADDDPAVFAAQEEACDDADNNCDGSVDEGCPCAPLGATQPCTTDCGSTGEETCTEGSWSACVPPSDEICNGADDNCDGLTDEGFTYTPMGERPISRDEAGDVRMIWAGDRFVVAWDEEQGSEGIHALTMQPDGTVIAGPTRLTEEIDAFDMASNGALLGVGWWDQEACGTNTCHPVRFQVFDLGTLEAASAEEQPASSAESDPRTRVVWDGDEFVLTFSEDGETQVVRYDPAGMQVGARTDTGGQGDKADVLWDGARLLLVYEEDPRLNLLTGDMGVFGPPVTLREPQGRRPEIVQTDDGFLVAHNVLATDAIEVLPIDGAGMMTGPALTLAMNVSRGGAPRNYEPGLAVADRQVVVTWVDNRGDRAHFARVGHDGQMIQAPSPLSMLTNDVERTVTASDGRVIWAAWTARQNPRQVQLARVACAPSSP